MDPQFNEQYDVKEKTYMMLQNKEAKRKFYNSYQNMYNKLQENNGDLKIMNTKDLLKYLTERRDQLISNGNYPTQLEKQTSKMLAKEHQIKTLKMNLKNLQLLSMKDCNKYLKAQIDIYFF